MDDNFSEIEPYFKRQEVSVSYLKEIIDHLSDGNSLPFERKSSLTLDGSGSIKIHNKSIPFELIPYLFEKLSSSKEYTFKNKENIGYKKYLLYLTDSIVEMIRYDTGRLEFYKDGKLHSLGGPAVSDKDLSVYYKNGAIHRTDGPAIKSKDENLYAINGEKLYFFDWIMKNPYSNIYSWPRGGKAFYYIYRFGNNAVVRGIDDTVIFLQKTTEKPTADNFIVELVSQRLSGYKVISYPNIGYFVKNIYNLIKESNSEWKYENNEAETILTNTTGFSKSQFVFNKEFGTLNFDSNAFSDKTNIKTDVSCVNSKPKEFPNIYIKRDEYGRKHSADGPAVKSLNKKEDFYIHGCFLTKNRFDNKIDNEDGSFEWVDENNEIHSDISFNPGLIKPTGEVKYYYHGLLHNDLMPAVYCPADTFSIKEYYIYGNPISAEAALKYKFDTREIIFKDENGLLHRDSGPAYMKFERDGSVEKIFYTHGIVHNDYGPGKLCMDGGFEYRINGKLHRTDGPAVWNPSVKIMEFYQDGVLHNDSGPAVIRDIGMKGVKEIEFWKNGKRDNPNIKSGQHKSESILFKDKGVKSMTDPNKTSVGRVSQFSGGAKSGLKKGAVKVVSEKLSETISSTFAEDSELPIKKLVQLGLLIGSSEVIERLPVGVTDKVGFTESKRLAVGKLNRELAGEILGRDAVELVNKLAPQIVEAIQNLSASEITDLALELQNEEESHSLIGE